MWSGSQVLQSYMLLTWVKSTHAEVGIAIHSWNPSPWKVETRGSGVRGHLRHESLSEEGKWEERRRGIWNLFLIINHSYPLPNSQWHTTQLLVSHRVPKRRYRKLPLSRQKRNMASHFLDYPKGTI